MLLGVEQKPRESQKQVVTKMAAVWVSVKLGDHMTREHLSEVLFFAPRS